MANPYKPNELFGEPHERITKAHVLRTLNCSQTHLAKRILGVPESTVTRWKRWVPKRWHERLRAEMEARKS